MADETPGVPRPGVPRHMYPKVSFKISATRDRQYMQRCVARAGNFVLNETSGPLIGFVATALVTCALKHYGICESTARAA